MKDFLAGFEKVSSQVIRQLTKRYAQSKQAPTALQRALAIKNAPRTVRTTSRTPVTRTVTKAAPRNGKKSPKVPVNLTRADIVAGLKRSISKMTNTWSPTLGRASA